MFYERKTVRFVINKEIQESPLFFRRKNRGVVSAKRNRGVPTPLFANANRGVGGGGGGGGVGGVVY
jgi:hypothetical protein